MRVAFLFLTCGLLAGCEREQREFSSAPRPAEQPGAPAYATAQSFERNAYHMAEGKRLFTWFNCVGCHGHGGGGMGPPLMDEVWLYGGAPEKIFESIRDGRPNGMPAFGGKIPETQIWQLAAYVRSMGRHVRKDAAPSRADDMFPGSSEVARPRAPEADDDEQEQPP